MRLKKEAISVTWKVQDEAASADGGAAARYPDNLAKIVNEGCFTKQQALKADEAAFD